MQPRGDKKNIFGTKAETLEKLQGKLKKSTVDKLIKFSVSEWRAKPNDIIQEVSRAFHSKKVIVRSSALVEDGFVHSNAGHFTSVGDVDTDQESLTAAIEKVIAKYDERADNQIFIQEFIAPAEISGVIFTRDINNLSPYIIINYDDKSGKTDTITSGKENGQKTLVIFKGYSPKNLDSRLLEIYAAVVELENIFGHDALDIEFIYKNNTVHIVQVRPLAVPGNPQSADLKKIRRVLDNIYDHIQESILPHPDLYGNKSLYGIMPDWNPAEMIGIQPRPLALSLYRELITDNVWAFQRDNYGYKKLRSFPLLESFASHPYIDVRVDFNSFIPKSLNDELSHKLANYYLEKLKSTPTSHDKVEFDIVFSCYSLDLDDRLQELSGCDFNDPEINEIKEALLDLTNNIIQPEGLFKQDLEKINILKDRFDRLVSSDLSLIKKIYWLTEDCKRYGTLPFAGIARAGFIAMQLLNSLVNLKIISLEEKNLFLGSLNTIAGNISNKIKSMQKGKISHEDFLFEFGHLRPGTYDILSESYEENFSKYFDLAAVKIGDEERPQELSAFEFSNEQMVEIDKLLKAHGLNIDAPGFIKFVKDAIEGREYAKYIFTKNINEKLKLITEYGKRLGLTRDDLSFIEIGTLLKLNSTVALLDEKRLLEDEITRNRMMHEFYKNLRLPYLICEPEDVYLFHMNEVEPNFITLNSVTGETVVLKQLIDKEDIKGKIVLIENADPGFDWIFSHNIKGLITAYGGANSHMAIRSAELNIPAVIGCGSVLFEEWARGNILEIDCLNKKVLTLK